MRSMDTGQKRLQPFGLMERGLGKASASYPWGSPVFSKTVRPEKSHPDTGRFGKETKEPISNTGDATEYTNGKFMHSPGRQIGLPAGISGTWNSWRYMAMPALIQGVGEGTPKTFLSRAAAFFLLQNNKNRVYFF